MALTFTYIPVYPVTRRSRPKIRGRMIPETDGITQARTVGQNQDLKSYVLRFIEPNSDADTLDRFLRDHDNTGAWFYWTPPQGSAGTYKCRQWTRTKQNCKWSEITATFDEVLVPLSSDVCICPSITGDFRQGYTLSLSTITCGTGAGTLNTIQWLRNGSPIPGATNPTYTTVGADQGNTISASIAYTTSLGNAATCTTAGVIIQAAAPFDPYFFNVTLFLHMNGTNGSTVFTDSSGNALTVTAVGNASISTAQSKFGGASGYFDGSGDYLTCTTAAFSTGDFTVESWIRVTSHANYRNIYESRASDSDAAGFVWGVNSSGQLYLYTAGNFRLTTGSIPLNTWTHAALTRSAGTWRMFINGILQTGTYSSSADLTRTSIRIGMDWATLYAMNGYMDEYRITTGIARYTTTFTPQTEAYPNLGPSVTDATFSSNSLLLHMDGTNGSVVFADSSSNALTTTAYGNAQISTTQSKYGGASGYFDGTGDYLQTNTNTLFDFSGNFTIECWVYNSANAANTGIITRRVLDTTGSGTWGIQVNNGTATFSNLQTSVSTTFGTISLNTWTHIAVSRNGNIIRLFLNGALNATITDSTNFTNTQNLFIGAWDRVGAGSVPTRGWFNGYIDDLRITKGVARYTAKFIPPAAAFSNS